MTLISMAVQLDPTQVKLEGQGQRLRSHDEKILFSAAGVSRLIEK